MAKTTDALAYIATKADQTVPLSLLRITTLLYLSDWRSALQLKRQITDVNWIQPFVAKTPEVAQLTVDAGLMITGQTVVVGLPNSSVGSELSTEERACIDFTLQTEAQKGWMEFFRLAYSTYPMFSQPVHSSLNLVELARRQREDIREHVS